MDSKILIIEDEPALLELYIFLLKKAGFRVEGVGNGMLGLKKIIKNTYDLVLLDVMLPQKDGLELLASLRKRKIKKLPIIILLTNLDQESIFEKAAQLGVSDFLIKSDVLPDEFIVKVQKWLS